MLHCLLYQSRKSPKARPPKKKTVARKVRCSYRRNYETVT